MKRILSLALFIYVAGLACPAPGAGVSSDPLGEVARSAQQKLDAASRQLAEARERTNAEQLPLARELTDLENRYAEIKKKCEQTSRAADAATLETAGFKATLKARQDEIQYIGNILDEYARGFESKIHPTELQRYGDVLRAAKQALEDTSLSAGERLARQMALVKVSCERIGEALGGMRFAGRAVGLDGVLHEGRFILVGPLVVFAAAKGGLAGLAVPQTGSLNPLVRPLEPASLNAGIAEVAEKGKGQVPLDPSRGGALKELVQRTSLIHIFEKGGPIMWPLLAVSILALGVVLERTCFLLLERRRRNPQAVQALFDAVARGETVEAVAAGGKSRDFVVRTLCYALNHKGSLVNALTYAQGLELKRYRRGIPVLDTAITLAPLLGLLGTVTGMMGSFSLIGGDLGAPGAITGGIAEALIATAFGLGIAITSVIPFNILNSRMEEARHELDTASTQLQLMLQPQQTALLHAAPAGGGK
jgi:biopolymer transport protein ExbB